MGREVKRIDKNFDWPLEKIWFGYIIPAVPCEHCNMDKKMPSGEQCPVCVGEGKAWPIIEPPKHCWIKEEENGWQMWETCSEGSPISPVCDSPEDLARWLADNKGSAFGEMTATYNEWLSMIKKGSAPSAYMTNEGMISGVEMVANQKEVGHESV